MRPPRFVPFAYGFRPFFLLAGLYALVAVGLWLWTFSGGIGQPDGTVPQHWHGHEMLFGFVAAAVAGFLLTAVPSWTGRRGFAGVPLKVLVALWFSGRVAFAMQHSLPWWLVVIAELSFMPALLAAVAPPLIRTVNRNSRLLFVLVALWCCDAVFLYATAVQDTALAAAALRAGIDTVLVLVTVIAGRIVPAFTANALRARGVEVAVRNVPALENSVVVVMLLYAVSNAVAPFGPLTASVAAVAGMLHAWRLSRWHGHRTLSQPIVWVLHLAYLWLPAGLFLKAIHIATGSVFAAHWLHALAAGAASTMIIAVMTRAALGHTGRALVAPRPVAAAYLLLALAVSIRVFGPAVWPTHYAETILAAGGLWMLAFGIYVVVYTPVLLEPRVDGRAG